MLISLLLVYLQGGATMSTNPIITIQEGQLKGKIATNCFGGKYFSFQGIPYAKPPIGELRFKAPQPPEPWSGTWDATAERSECYSRHMILKHLVGSEDCLYLNVYTPQLPSTNTPKPVMVWIHGGGFVTGSGNTDLYSPDFLLREEIVLVTINYRLGLLGFLSMENPSFGVPGNAGLKDQVLALKWVQKNIANFNGDPNNVTVFGESAGGTAAHFLMLSPMAKGLFHKVVVQSGCALGCRATGQRSSPSVAKALGLSKVDEEEVLKILIDLPVEKILEIQEKIPDRFMASEERSIGPVIETASKEEAFLAEEVMDILVSGRFNKVPLMIGYTTREGMLLAKITKSEHGEVQLVMDFEQTVPHMLKIPKGSEMSKKVAQNIRQFYYGKEEPSLEIIDQYYLLQTDNFFLRPIHDTVRLHVAASTTPVYFYRMSVDSKLNFFKLTSQITDQGVCHADDLGYLFKNMFTPEIRPGSIEDEGIRRFTKLWATFARNGDPNPVEKDTLINVTWKAAEKSQYHFLDIGENLTVGVNPEAGRMTFWDKIYKISKGSSL